MNNEISLMYAILNERHKPWLISFKAENSTQDGNFGIKFTVCQLPESDAILEYIGFGDTFEKAFDMLVNNVKNGYPKENWGDDDHRE